MFTYLFQDDENSTIRYGYRKIFKKPLKEVWISHNIFQCRCTNEDFIDFLQDDLNTKVGVVFFRFLFHFSLVIFVQKYHQQLYSIFHFCTFVKKLFALFSGR